MYFERFISRRYLKAKRKQSFISLISIISMVGVALGVCALIVVLSVMNGMQKDVRDRILGIYAHVMVMSHRGVVQDYQNVMTKAEKTPGIIAASPFIYSQAMLSFAGRVSGAVIRGIDPTTAPKVTTLSQSLRGGDATILSAKIKDPRPDAKKGDQAPVAIVLGVELARNLGAGVGSVVRLISPVGRVTAMGRTEWHQDFVVADLFQSGMYEYDSTMAFLSLEQARSFLGMSGGATGVELKVNDIYKAGEIGLALGKELGFPYWVRDWMQTNHNLFSALKLEKTVMFIILALIVVVATFNIVSTLIMVVMEKTKDIAILKAIGASSRSIMKIFVYQGMIIGSIGTGLGLALGLILCELLKRYKFIQLPKDVYYLDTLPVRVDPMDVALVVAASLTITFLATLYPSRQGARLDPVEAIRYE